MNRMTDEELRMMADSQPLGPSWIRDVLLELCQHRARIAAHAAAHPERLSEATVDEYTQAVRAADEHGGVVYLGEDDVRSAILEIQQRRAADLTPDEVEAIQTWRERAIYDRLDDQPAMDAIDKILRAHGVTP